MSTTPQPDSLPAASAETQAAEPAAGAQAEAAPSAAPTAVDDGITQPITQDPAPSSPTPTQARQDGAPQDPAPAPAPPTQAPANPQPPKTILLLHGAHASSSEFTPLPPLLSSYTLLTPTYPTNSTPYTLTSTTTSLATLITPHAPVHLIGISLGAHQALHLAATHPELIASILVSGLQDWPARAPRWQRPLLPYLMYADATIARGMPRFATRALLDGWTPREGAMEGAARPTVESAGHVVDALRESCEGQGKVQARCLVVCATKRGVLPTDDSVEAARAWRERLRGAHEVRLVEARECRHTWHVMRPELFAQTVAAWVEGRMLPDEMDDL